MLQVIRLYTSAIGLSTTLEAQHKHLQLVHRLS